MIKIMHSKCYTTDPGQDLKKCMGLKLVYLQSLRRSQIGGDTFNSFSSNAQMIMRLYKGHTIWLFAGSYSNDEHVAVLYSLIDSCHLNNMVPEKWLRHVIGHIEE